MSLMASFYAVLFPRDVLDEIWDSIESVSGSFPIYSFKLKITKGHQSVKELGLIMVINPCSSSDNVFAKMSKSFRVIKLNHFHAKITTGHNSEKRCRCSCGSCLLHIV